MTQPKPITRNYSTIIDSIRDGIYQIPKFQRNFVWNRDKMALLIDSIIKGYPIGTFIMWRTKERLKAIKKIGNQELNFPSMENDYIYYILDGQQRITSLYLAINGIGNELYINLDKIDYVPSDNKEADILFKDISDPICLSEVSKDIKNSIKLSDLIKLGPVKLMKKFDSSEEVIGKIDVIKRHIQNYEFSTIEIENQELEKIVDVFTRINTTGTELTLFQIMNAKLYDENNNFDLEEKYNELCDELSNADFDTLLKNPVVILQIASAILKNDVKRKSMLSITKDDFINKWDDIVKCLQKAVDKIRSQLFIPVSNLLPYNALIINIAYFYYINDINEPDHTQTENLKKYFYRAAFASRYSQSADSLINQDLNLMKKIQKNENIDFDVCIPLNLQFKDKEALKTFLIETDFKTTNAICKAILCLLAGLTPLSFKDNSKILIDNSWLSRANSKNYHHFFPKNFIKDEPHKNSIVNIVFIGEMLNKKEIRDKAPSDYIIKKYKEQNHSIQNALKTHFIGELELFGIDTDDYSKFLDERANLIADEILSVI